MTAWNDELDAMLRRCAADKMTAAETATAINEAYCLKLSRNAIIGRGHRKGVYFNSGKSGRFVPAAELPPVPQVKPRLGPAKGEFHYRRNKTSVPLPPPRIVPTEPKPEGVRFADLREHSCRFPLGDWMAKAEFFCGRQRESLSSYCKKHAAVCESHAAPRLRLPVWRAA
jgi:GcrA cell cycle regulator